MAASGPVLEVLLSDLGFGFMLVFARLGAAVMVLPAYGELWISPRIRLVFSLALTILVLPLVLADLPTTPATPSLLALHLGHETLIGLFVGFCIRVVASAATMAGSLIALQAGLANALQPGIVGPDATATLGIFLGLLLIAFIVNSGLDHVMLRAVIQSYQVLPPPAAEPVFPPFGDLVTIVGRAVAESFALGFWIAFPVILSSFLVNLGLGLSNRFMPQLQVYFLGLPITIVVALGLMALTAPAMLHAIHEAMLATVTRLGGG